MEHLSLAHSPRLWTKDLEEENNETPRNGFNNWNAFIVNGDTSFLIQNEPTKYPVIVATPESRKTNNPDDFSPANDKII